MDVDVIGVSLAATAGVGYVYLTTRQTPSSVSTGILVPVSAGIQTHLRRFDIMPLVNSVVVRTNNNVKWLAQSAADGAYYAAAAVTSAAGAGVNYIWRKTVNATASVTQSVMIYAFGAGAVVLLLSGKRKRYLM